MSTTVQGAKLTSRESMVAALTPLLYEATQKEIHTDGTCQSVVFSFDGRHLVCVSQSHKATRWRVTDGRREGSWMTDASAVAVSRDEKWLVAGRDDGKLSILDAKTLKQFAETAGHHNGTISALDVSPNSSRVASASHDGTIILWAIPAGRRLSGPLKLGLGSLDWVSHLQFSPAGDRLAACYDSQHGAVFVWDVSGDRLTQRFKVTFAYPSRLGWSNDGQRVFVGSLKALAVINASTGSTSLRSISSPNLHVSGNDKFLIIGKDFVGGVQFRDILTGAQIGPVLHDHTPLAISLDGNLLVTACSASNTISVWSLRELLPRHCTISVSTLTALIYPTSLLTKSDLLLPSRAPHQSVSCYSKQTSSKSNYSHCIAFVSARESG